MTTTMTAPETPPELLERVVIGGDLSKLQPGERLQYYREVCTSLGLNPLTRPFQYLTLNGKLILYASRDATDQLRRQQGVSIQIVAREQHGDVYAVTARATTAGGRADESIGAVTTASLKGDALANALMKAETKAKRRVTLSICGLGMMDETEVETVPGAVRVEAGDVIPVLPPSVELPDAAPPTAPEDDWTTAMGAAESLKALQSLWQRLSGPDVWGTFTAPEQKRLIAAKEANKMRLGGG